MMRTSLKNGYFFDPLTQDRFVQAGLGEGFVDGLAKAAPPLPESGTLVDDRGLVLVKVPKTGTQSFQALCLESYFPKKPGGAPLAGSSEALTNRLCWELWPNLHMMARIAGESPWVVGGTACLPEQYALLRQYRDLAPGQGGAGLKLLLAHWPWRYDPEIYARVMVSPDPHVVAIFREPRARALSSYFYEIKRARPGETPSIEGFAAFLEHRYDRDFYCRWYSHPGTPDAPDYDLARDNIAGRIDTVGVTEQYPRFLRLCHRRFGLLEENRNVNPGQKTFGLGDLPPRVGALLDTVTQGDRMLYDVALARFEADCRAAGI